LGIADIDCKDMIDLDKYKVLIKHANPKFAKCMLLRPTMLQDQALRAWERLHFLDGNSS
jgi:hypothetical protein